MLAKIAMQASQLYAEATKAFNEAEGNSALSQAVVQSNAKKDYFEVSFDVISKQLNVFYI